MIADWSVEVSADGPSIDVPWPGWIDLSGPSGPQENKDKGKPWNFALASSLAEVRAYPELLPMLEAANNRNTLTSKIDVFPVSREDADPEIAESGEIETRFGLGSYMDVLAHRLDIFSSFAQFEALARIVAERLKALTMPLTCAEIVLRPAQLHEAPTFGWTLYALGFGPTEEAARACWERAAMMVVILMTQRVSECVLGAS